LYELFSGSFPVKSTSSSTELQPDFNRNYEKLTQTGAYEIKGPVWNQHGCTCTAARAQQDQWKNFIFTKAAVEQEQEENAGLELCLDQFPRQFLFISWTEGSDAQPDATSANTSSFLLNPSNLRSANLMSVRHFYKTGQKPVCVTRRLLWCPSPR